MSFKKNYRTVRSMAWLWYTIAAIFFFTAMSQPVGSLGWIIMIGMTTGMVVAAKRSKRKATNEADEHEQV